MKRVLFCSALLGIFCMTGLLAQTIVVTAPQHKNVVLEEFTGINCGYCPQGHAVAQAISDANPGRVVLVNIHQGSFAAPTGTEPDYRTIFGDSLALQANVTGYPNGTINRHVFPEIGASTAMGRGSWNVAAQQILPEQSPVNIGFTSAFDSASRVLTVKVEAYYTANSPAVDNYLNVALLENHVHGFQEDYANGNQPNYDHKHMLRWFITGQWGDQINPCTQGSLVTRVYNYTVPAAWNVDSCDVAVYITESHNEIYTGVMAQAKGGSNNGATAMYIGTIAEPTTFVAHGTVSQATLFNTTVTSSLTGTESFAFSLTSNAPNDWSGSFTVGGNNFTDTGTVSLVNYTPLDVTVSITPGATPAFATYTLTMSSVSNPAAPPKTQNFYVIYGITDLIVDGTGGWGNGLDYNFDSTFTSAFQNFGGNTYALTDADIMVKAFTANAFAGLENIYLNIAWRFPSLSDDQATAVMGFMNGGGNIFICGQDIGWDIKSGSGYGTTVTTNFYDNYLHATWSADGSATNSQFTAITSDPIFGSLSSSGIVDVFNGNIYPDQIGTGTGAIAIFNYNSNASLISGIRFDNQIYKVVYIAVDMEMLSDFAAKNNILKTTYQWFHGLVNIPEEQDASISLYPNPGNGKFFISGSKISSFKSVDVFSITGDLVMSRKIDNSFISEPIIDLGQYADGLYFVKVSGDNQVSTFKVTLAK
ncbi:MAG: Omp28-related outer membrane protein [Bacteroidia bacterium]|nr:Omp28-related outer membrane protein [Bacteroidia bacterium]